jgi:hypothetical protein
MAIWGRGVFSRHWDIQDALEMWKGCLVSSFKSFDRRQKGSAREANEAIDISDKAQSVPVLVLLSLRRRFRMSVAILKSTRRSAPIITPPLRGCASSPRFCPPFANTLQPHRLATSQGSPAYLSRALFIDQHHGAQHRK